MFVQVRCIIVSRPSTFSIVLASSKVRSAVLPPAPQVTSTNAGSSRPIRSTRAYRFSIPASVFGGKYSNE